MINKYLIFRTDRIGDFLITAILINSIKRNDSNSIITVVSSEKNYNYIKSFKNVDEVILLKNDLFNKIKLIKKLRSIYFNYIIVHDLKKRSFLITLFLKYKFKIKPNVNLNISYINSICEILLQLNFNFNKSDLNTLHQRHDYYPSEFINNDFILFHFDEKWIHNNYISEYTNIEPTENNLISFINLLLLSSDKEVVITTGVDCPRILDNILDNNFNNRVKIYKELDFLHLESLISKCKLLISCHGSVSHVAAAYNIKQIDIIEGKKFDFYSKWTDHFRGYFPLYRKKFSDLSKEIIDLL